MLTWLIRIVLLVLLAVGGLIGVILIAEPELRLTPYRETLSQHLSDLLGRDIAFDGDVQLKLGRHAALHLTRVQLANAEWAQDDSLLSAGRVSVGIDLRALVSGKVHLEGIVLRDIAIALEESAAGEVSWDIGDPNGDEPAEHGDGRPFSLIVEDAQVDQVRVQYRSPQRAEPLVVTIEQLSQHERDRMLMLDGRGTIGSSSVTLAGHVGTLDALLAGRDIDLDLSTSIDNTVIRLRGRLGEPARLEGLDVEGGIRGPSLAELLAVFGIDYAAGGDIDAHLVIKNRDPGLETSVRGHIGALQIDANGLVGNPVAADDVSLDLAVSGKDLSTLGRLLGVHGLPVEAYSLKGKVERNAGRLRVSEFVATSGDSRAQLDAEIPAFPTLSGGTATVDLRLAELRRYLSSANGQLPPGPLVARVALSPESGGASRLDAQLDQAGNSVALNGNIGQHPGYEGTRLAFSVDMPDVQPLFPATGRAPRAVTPLRAGGHVSIDDGQRLMLTVPGGRLGEMHFEAEGTLGRIPSMNDADLTVKASGPSLQSFASAFLDAPLPGQPYRIETRLQGDANRVHITSILAEVGKTRLRGNGPIGPLPRLDGTDTELELDVPRIAELLPQAVDEAWTQAGYRARARLGVRDKRIHLTDGVIQGDHVDASLSAQIAEDLSPQSARIELQVKTPALNKVLPAIKGYAPPDAPLSVAIAIQPLKHGIDVRRLDIRLADATVRANGSVGLGDAGKTTLKFEAKGPSLGQLGSFDGAALRAEPFAINGTLSRQNQRYDIDDLVLNLGEGSLKGSIGVLVAAPPTVEIALDSQGKAFNFLADPGDPPASTAEAEPQESADRRPAVILDTPIELDALAQLNGRLRLTASDAGYPDPAFPDHVIIDTLDLDIRLQDGNLTLAKLHAAGNRGQVDLTGGIERQGDQAGINLALEARDFRFGLLAAGTGLEALPSHTVSANIAGLGHTYRSLAASLNGNILIEGGRGKTDNTRTNQALGRFADDLISTLNPFRKSEPQTRIDCTAVAATVTDGVLQLFPGGVIRTDKLDIAASGTIDLETERLDIQFRTVPREGLGISVAGVVQPYVKVGGTLSQPGMTLDAPKALLSGTAAVATGGLSILATSLLDRATGAINPCTEVMSKAESGKRTSTLNPIDILGNAINRSISPKRPPAPSDGD